MAIQKKNHCKYHPYWLLAIYHVYKSNMFV